MINQINVGVIGTGWCGGIRANACHDTPLVNKLFLAETNTKRLNELKNSLDIEGATENWKELINNDITKVEKGVKIKVLIIEELLTVNLKTANSEIKFVLKGKMDRVQEEDGMLHVLDYKTGNVEPNKLTFTDNKDIIQNKKT